MKRMAHQLWRDDAGFVISAELILVATVVVIGLIAGLATLRNQLVQELGDSAAAVSSLNQGYQYSTDLGNGTNTNTFVYGDVEVTVTIGDSSYVDEPNEYSGVDVAGDPPSGITIGTVTVPGGSSESDM